MRGEELLEKMELAAPEYIEAAERMPRVRRRAFRWIAAAACIALLALGSAGLWLNAAQPKTQPVRQGAPAADAPAGRRKTFIYDGWRYVFLENGSTYLLEPEQLGEQLRVLDSTATFAVGGVLVQVNGYDPLFRVAVEWEGDYYIGERVGAADGSDMDAAEYLSSAGFAQNVEKIEICDHYGNEVLDTLNGKEAVQLLALFAEAQPAKFTNEEYERIARAQSEGKSFRLRLLLNDTTQTGMYVIPSMSIVMIGDNRYVLPEEPAKELVGLLDGLEAQTRAPQIEMG